MTLSTDTGDGLRPGRILVTGAAGFAGTHLMRELGMCEGDVAVDIGDDFQVPNGVRSLAWDLNCEPPHDLDGFDYIVHLAAMSSVGKSLADIRKAYEINLIGTVSLLEFTVSRCPDARILIVSSAEVYRPSDGRLGEDSEIGPINPYGSTKAAAEIAALQFARSYDLDVVIARPFPHIGPGQSADFAFPSFCRRIIEARRHGIGSMRVGNLLPVRDYLYVTDVARAYGDLLAHGRSGEAYNICSGTGHSVEDMLRQLMEIAGVSLELEVDPQLFRPVDVEFQVGDPSRMMALHGWRPEIDLNEGLRRLFSWWEARS